MLGLERSFDFIYRLVLIDLPSNKTQAIRTGQAAVGVSSSIDTCQIEEPRAVVRLGDSIYFSTGTGSSRFAIMKLSGMRPQAVTCILQHFLLYRSVRWDYALVLSRYYTDIEPMFVRFCCC